MHCNVEMEQLNRRGAAAFEFALVAVPLFTLIFVIFDLGRYAITMQSLWALANAELRALMVQCYGPDKIKKRLPIRLWRRRLPLHQAEAGRSPVPLFRWSHSDREFPVAPFRRPADGHRDTIALRHAYAGMGHGVQRAQRIHLNSILARISQSPLA